MCYGWLNNRKSCWVGLETGGAIGWVMTSYLVEYTAAKSKQHQPAQETIEPTCMRTSVLTGVYPHLVGVGVILLTSEDL